VIEGNNSAGSRHLTNPVTLLFTIAAPADAAEPSTTYMKNGYRLTSPLHAHE
jgi:hypothetical protein